MEIKSSDISVVVQGKIYAHITKKCLESIRKYLPGAEIILSTWKNENLSGLDYDELVLSDDIGAGSIDSLGVVNNYNRQIVSSKRGVGKATKNYILKIRSDMYLINNSFLVIYGEYASGAIIFGKRILVGDFYTRNPRVIPMPYHISDWFFFGQKKDVFDYVESAKLQSKVDDEWFLYHKNKNKFFKNMLTRYAPEQYFCLSFFSRFYDLTCLDYADNSDMNINLTEEIIAQNFIVVDSLKSGFKFTKYNPNRFKERLSLLGFREWLFLYNHYVRGQSLLLYKIICIYRKVIYFYIRRGFSMIFDFLHIKKYIRELLSR